MISVWDPIILPWGFDYKRAGMLKEATGPFGAGINAHWQNRNHLVTSKIETLVEAPAANSVADFEALTLSMAAGLSRDHYMHEISEFAHEAHRRALAGERPYQFSRLEHDETIRNVYASTTSAKMASMAFAFTNGGD